MKPLRFVPARFVAATAFALAMMVGLATATATPTAAAPSAEPPAAIRAPAGAKLVTRLHATGDQVYGCTATDGKYGWTLKRPDAKLFDAGGAQVGTHGAGPSWTAKDGSSVTAEKVAQADAPVADAIAWLLLRAKSTSGAGQLAKVTYVQRLDTKGGKAPAAGCDAAHLNTETRSSYSADYYFFSGGATAAAVPAAEKK